MQADPLLSEQLEKPLYSQINYKKTQPINEHKDSSTKNPDEPIGYKPWITDSQLKSEITHDREEEQ